VTDAEILQAIDRQLGKLPGTRSPMLHRILQMIITMVGRIEARQQWGERTALGLLRQHANTPTLKHHEALEARVRALELALDEQANSVVARGEASLGSAGKSSRRPEQQKRGRLARASWSDPGRP